MESLPTAVWERILLPLLEPDDLLRLTTVSTFFRSLHPRLFLCVDDETFRVATLREGYDCFIGHAKVWEREPEIEVGKDLSLRLPDHDAWFEIEPLQDDIIPFTVKDIVDLLADIPRRLCEIETSILTNQNESVVLQLLWDLAETRDCDLEHLYISFNHFYRFHPKWILPRINTLQQQYTPK